MQPSRSDLQQASALKGKQIAFTGRLASMSRREAMRLVREQGARTIEGVSRRTDLLVVGMEGWPMLADGSISRKLRQAELLQERGHGIEILSEQAFVQRLQTQAPPPAVSQRACSPAQAARILGVDAAVVRRCEQFGVIRSVDGELDFRDLVSLRTAVGLLGQGMTPSALARGLSQLARHLPELEQPLAQVRLLRDGDGSLLAELGGVRMDTRGQMLFSFEPLGPAPSVARLPEPEPSGPDAEECFREGVGHEENGRIAPAMQAYAEAIRRRSGFTEAHYNLANLHLQQECLAEAGRHYLLAVEADPTFAAAWYNLGYLRAEENRFAEAEQALLKAVAALPDYADAHFNLALCREELGRSQQARQSWRDFLRLQPRGDCADFARRQLLRPLK